MKRTLLFIIISFFYATAYNQELTDHKNLLNSLPAEKIYLHLDRPNYMQGDTIWFKAYSWFGFDQLPDTVSKVLYVDLLNTGDSVEMKRKLLIQNGTSNGEFCLDKNIPPGRYTVRAYTRWMQNKNAGEPFYQIITIGTLNQNLQVDCSPLIIKQKEGDSLKVVFRYYEIDQAGDLKSNFIHNVDYRVRIGDRLLNSGRALSTNNNEQILKFPLPEIGKNDSVALIDLSIKEEGLTFEKQFQVPLKEELDLQFFPEGGSLVEGLESRVAFKATGTDGLSREIKGVIKTGDGKVVSTFESSHKGMGSFLLTPESGQKYTALAQYNHREFQFNLPSALNEGFVMSVETNDSDTLPSLKVHYSPLKSDELMYVTGSAYGQLRFIATLKTTKDSSVIKLPVDLLPEGVSRLTLLDRDYKPVAERLLYVDRDQRIKIEVKADSSSYGTRSKITLLIKTTDTDGEPIPANLSLSVVDKEQIINGEGIHGISAYKLLESELKGYIEDPGFYFSDSIINHKALDLLLLTQGYRRFLPEKPAEIKYLPERSFDITGKVALPGNRNQNFNYSDLGLTLLCHSDKTFFDQTKPDSLGQFSFHIPLMDGKPLSLLRAYTSKGKLTREKLPKDKSFRGDILLDEIIAPKFTTPAVSEINISTPVTEYVQQLQSAKKIEISKIKHGDTWHLNLPEVSVTAKYKDKYWYTRFEDEAKKIVNMDSLDPAGNKYGNVYDLLVREFGARRVHEPRVETITMPTLRGWNYWFPIYILNGKTYFNGGEGGQIAMSLLNMLSSIKVNEIKKIMVLPPSNLTYHYADPGILIGGIKQSLVNIETYSKPNFYRGDPDGIKTFILDGLDTPRTFYSPRYEGSNKENPGYDGRATLYWKPSVRTDQNGESKVEFYTGDRRTELEVIVNGIQIGSGNTGEKQTIIKSAK